MAFTVRPGEEYTFRQEVYFEEHLYGSDTGIPSGQIIIQRGDGLYWNGTAFVAGEQIVPTTINSPATTHEYTFIFPQDLDTIYNFTMRVNNDIETDSCFTAIVRLGLQSTFDGVDFATGFPSTVLTE